jgi:uracil-DNA glycosylase
MTDMNRGNSFENLQHRMQACRLCLDSGHFVEPPAVTQGSCHALITTIGQAPGITEVQAGRPFNAGSGKRLFQWLGEAGIDEPWFRKTQYMTSVTKCYPGRSKSGSGDRVPSRNEQTLCRQFLDEELGLINPRLIIPIGRLAINLYYPTKLKLNEIIGTQIELDKRWIIPLPHSSGASRWHQTEGNRDLINYAIELIKQQFLKLFSNRI